MGALYSKSRRTAAHPTQPPGQSNRPGQRASHNPEPIPASPNPYISAPSPLSPRKKGPTSASRSDALGETERSNRRPKLLNLPWVNSKRSGSTGGHPPQARTPRPSLSDPYRDAQTNGLEEGTPDVTSDRADVQQPRSARRGASGASRGVRQMPQLEVDKVKATEDRPRRSPQAMDVSFAREYRLGNRHSKGRLATGLVDRSETASAKTTEPPPNVISPSSQIPHPDTDNIQPLDTPPEPPLCPFISQRQRSVFKRIDCIPRGYSHLKNSDRASLKPSASISLPDLRASIPPQPTELDQKSLRFPKAPIRFLRPCYSLSELRDGLLSTNGKPSAKIEALDCTNRLSERTEIKGVGAYSDVSQATLDNRLAVAVRALRATGIEGTDEIRMRKRLGREIHVWAALRHPNILEFLSFAFEGGRPCLISPWCEHGTLSVYLKKNRNADRGSLVCQIAEGLKYLHLQNPPVLHGDLKTANVLITKDHIAKISDFGVSKHLGEGKTGFTTEGFVSVTIRYCAPETLKEGEHHTLQSDVYSFACVALETLSSKFPFWKLSKPAAIITKVVIEKEIPSPGDHRKLKDDRLWELLRRCWSYEPSDRPKMFDVCRKLAREGYRSSHHPPSGSV